MIKTYVGDIIKLEPNEVFVFGSNLQGFHGAGAAGYASFNVFGNVWRQYDYANKPSGWKGKWNVKGIAEGFQQGEIGCSYAIPTVSKPGQKKSLSPDTIINSINNFYDFSWFRNDLKFYVAQKAVKGLNGYEPRDMAAMFSSNKLIPDNVYFEINFAQLINDILNNV